MEPDRLVGCAAGSVPDRDGDPAAGFLGGEVGAAEDSSGGARVAERRGAAGVPGSEGVVDGHRIVLERPGRLLDDDRLVSLDESDGER